MKKTFWNGGKEVSDKIKNARVDWGYTENRNANVVIAVNSIYYDMYNNGGCNLFDDDFGWNDEESYLSVLVKRILDADIGFKFGNINLKLDDEEIMGKLEKEDKDRDYFELEKFMDEVFDVLEKTDLTFPIYTTYFSHNKQELSNSKKGLQSQITFGEKKEQEQWEQTRIQSGYKKI